MQTSRQRVPPPCGGADDVSRPNISRRPRRTAEKPGLLRGASNAGRLALRGNKSAVVKGGALRNSGTLLLCGSSAIRFDNAALDSAAGTVLLGQHSTGCTPTELRFTDADGHTLSITSAPNAVGELHNVTITPTAIRGHGPNAALRRVKITGNPNLINVKLD